MDKVIFREFPQGENIGLLIIENIRGKGKPVDLYYFSQQSQKRFCLDIGCIADITEKIRVCFENTSPINFKAKKRIRLRYEAPYNIKIERI